MSRTAVLVAALIVCPLFAQETSEITGRIVDASGAPVAAASVEVQGVQTGVKWDTLTNSDGYYTQALLPPAEYRVTVKMTGFKLASQNTTLVMEQVARMDFALQVGSQSETVEVTAEAPLLESSTASIGQVIDNQPINDLPLNGRNYLDLAKLSIGVSEPVGTGTTGTTGDRAKNGGAFIANGTRSDQNNFILDGIDNNSKIPDLSSNTNVVIQPSVDAIGEFKVETNTYSPEYGHSGGAVLSVTTKSGTNSVHGSAFEFLRNDAVDARNFFLPASDSKQELRQSQYGVTLGGPIRKNKTFLFGSWQGSRQNSGTTYVSTLANPAMLAGNFSAVGKTITDPAAVTVNADGTFNRPAFPGNMIPASRISQTASMMDALIPAPNVPGAGAANNFVSTPVANNNRDGWDTRADQNFSDSDRMFIRFSYYKLYVYNPGPFPQPLVGSTSFQESINNQSGYQGVIGYTHVFSGSLINDFRTGYNRVSNALADFVSQNLDSQYGFGFIPPHAGITGLPQLTFTGTTYSDLGEAGFLPDAKGSDSYQVTDSLQWTKGKHYFKFGGEFRWQRSRYDILGDARGLFNFNGTFTGNSFADYELGFPNQETLNSELAGDMRYKYYGAYIADDWKVTPRLTLNLGLRWEYEGEPVSGQNLLSNFIVGPNVFIYPNNSIPATSIIPAQYAGEIPSGVDPRALMKNFRFNLAPRLGLAYQLRQHTVLRMGGGVFLAEADALGLSSRPESNPPFKATYNPPAGNGVQPTFSFASGFPATAENPQVFNPTTGTIYSYNPDERPTRIYKWSADLQQDLGKFLLDVGYVATKGADLAVSYNINESVPGSTPAAQRFPYQGLNQINYTDSLGNSEYNALQVRIERRWTNGMSMLASYTWSKAMGYGNGSLTDGGNFGARNAMDLGWDRSVLSGVVPQRFVVSYSYALPIGHGKRLSPNNGVVQGIFGDWQVNGITTVRDGQWFTPSTSVNSANTNGRNAPNWDPSVHTPGFTPSVGGWFDTAEFSQPVQYTYGNEGPNVMMGPGAINFDASIMKIFTVHKLGEGGRVQLRFEGFNIFNHPNFANPSNVVIGSAGVGSLVSTTTPNRILQAGVKVMF